MNRLFLPILLLLAMAGGCVSLPPETMVLLREELRELFLH